MGAGGSRRRGTWKRTLKNQPTNQPTNKQTKTNTRQSKRGKGWDAYCLNWIVNHNLSTQSPFSLLFSHTTFKLQHKIIKAWASDIMNCRSEGRHDELLIGGRYAVFCLEIDCQGSRLLTRAQRSSRGSTDHVRGLSLNHRRQDRREPCLMHSIACWTGPNHWLSLVQQFGQSNKQDMVIDNSKTMR